MMHHKDSTCNITPNQTNISNIHNLFMYPCLLLLVLTLVLAATILVALLIVARGRHCSVNLLYFNITVTDVAMALLGITILLRPTDTSMHGYKTSVYLAQALRINWQCTVVLLMLNRLRLVKGKPGFSLFSTKVLIATSWLFSSLDAFTYYMISPGAPWESVNDTLGGAILNNLLQIIELGPTVTVLVVLPLIACRANRVIMAGEQLVMGEEVLGNMQSNMKLLYAFGIVYLAGFGFDALSVTYNLLNLCGYVELVPPLWGPDGSSCTYFLATTEVCNILMNLSNSLIISQTRQIKRALRKMYRTTTRMVKSSVGMKQPLLGSSDSEAAEPRDVVTF